MGYDKPQSLGGSETGGSAALPIWIKYMSSALRGVADNYLSPPDGVSSIRINLKTGNRAHEDESGFYEYFYQEYPPPEKGGTGTNPIASDATDTNALS